MHARAVLTTAAATDRHHHHHRRHLKTEMKADRDHHESKLNEAGRQLVIDDPKGFLDVLLVQDDDIRHLCHRDAANLAIIILAQQEYAAAVTARTGNAAAGNAAAADPDAGPDDEVDVDVNVDAGATASNGDGGGTRDHRLREPGPVLRPDSPADHYASFVS